MALDQYHHGVRVIEINDGTRTIRTIATAIIGAVLVSTDADDEVFPLNKPVLFTNLTDAIGKAGTTGNLKRTLQIIDMIAKTPVVVVRVDEGVDTAATTSNIIGTIGLDGVPTGLEALKRAESVVGVRPRILGVPGHDSLAVTAALTAVAQSLRAFCYAHAVGDTISDVKLYREGFSDRELMLIYGDFTKWDTTADAQMPCDAVAVAMALRAKIDKEIGWHKTLSNVGVPGVEGLTKAVYWELQNPDTDAGLLNENDITCLIRREGMRFWGNRTCSDDKLFQFENYTRTAQILADTIAEAHMWAVDKPMTPTLVKDIIEGINAKLRELVNLGYLIGANCWYDDTLNDKDTLKAGKLRIRYNYTPVPPLEDLGLMQEITDEYLIDFAAKVAAA
ncbi:phage tail sheath protein [Aeromonas veronii]